jgi:flagellar FliJ protein
MKRFSFDLEKVLELRSYREREAEIALGKAIGELTLIEQEIKSVTRERFQAASERFGPGNGGMEIQRYDLYIRRLDAALDKRFKEAAQAELKVEEARLAFLEASREKKAMENLKERRQKEYRKTFLTEETRNLDDIAGGAAVRQRTGAFR